MNLNPRHIAIAASAALALTLSGCGAGSADIPASVPHPRKMSDGPGQSLADVAKAKGMNVSGQPAPGTPAPPTGRGFNPTNPTNP